LTVTGYLHVR